MSRAEAMVTGVVLGMIASCVMVWTVAGVLPYTRHGVSVVLLLLSVPLTSWAGARFGLCAVGLREMARRLEAERVAAEPENAQ